MRISGNIRSLAAAAVLVAVAPLGAFTLVESSQKVPVARGDSFSSQVTLSRAVITDGTHSLKANVPYRVDIVSMGDGSVRASFFDSRGQKAGEANGIIAVLKSGAPGSAPPGAASGQTRSVQKVAPAGGGQAQALNFTKLGFGPNSRSNLVPQGEKQNLEIVSADGTHSVLIGLLLPAVQKAREAAIKQ